MVGTKSGSGSKVLMPSVWQPAGLHTIFVNKLYIIPLFQVEQGARLEGGEIHDGCFDDPPDEPRLLGSHRSSNVTTITSVRFVRAIFITIEIPMHVRT